MKSISTKSTVQDQYVIEFGLVQLYGRQKLFSRIWARKKNYDNGDLYVGNSSDMLLYDCFFYFLFFIVYSKANFRYTTINQ